jgi:hypothetical protein
MKDKYWLDGADNNMNLIIEELEMKLSIDEEIIVDINPTDSPEEVRFKTEKALMHRYFQLLESKS